MKLGLLLTSVFFITNITFANSDGMGNRLPSLSWQRQNLENGMRLKIEDVLSSIISKNQYSVDIEIQTNDPSNPNWNKTDDPFKIKGNDLKAESELASEVDEKEASEGAEDKNLGKVRFTDPEPLETPEDFIVFNKFGLEAPLIDDFNDFQPDGKILLAMGDGSSKKKGDEKANYKRSIADENERNKGKVSEAERMWKYNNAIDIFNNLKEVSITLRVSKGLSDDVKQAVEKYSKAINFNLGKIKPKIKFEYVLMGSDINKPSMMDKIDKFFNYFSRFGTLFGIIFGVLLFGLVGNKLISKFFELKGGDSSSSSMSMEMPEREESDESDVGGATAMASGEGAAGSMQGLNGVERFKTYTETSKNDAVLLVKKWIMEDDKRGKNALKALVQQMENQDLGVIFNYLNESEKNDWRKLLDKPLKSEDLIIANDFISNQIVQNIIIPSFIDDPETYDLLLKLRPEQLVELIHEDALVSSYLMNALSLSFVNQVLAKCDEDVRKSIIESSMQVRPQDIIDNQDKIKQVLIKYVSTRETSPFVDKILQLIPISNPEFEETLYSNLAMNADRLTLEQISTENFPSSLIESLPEAFLKSVLMSYPLMDKVKMLATIEAELKSRFIDIFAPVGTKANDMIQLEFDNLERDESELEKIQKEASTHWKGFVDYTRAQIKKDKQYTYEIQTLLNGWIDLKIENSPKHENHLQAVA